MQERLLCEIGNFIFLDTVFSFMAHVQRNFQISEMPIKNGRAAGREVLLFKQ